MSASSIRFLPYREHSNPPCPQRNFEQSTCRFCHLSNAGQTYNTLSIHELCLPLLKQASLEARKAAKALSKHMNYEFADAFDQVDFHLETHFKGISMKDFLDAKGASALRNLFDRTAPCSRLYYETHHDEIWAEAFARMEKSREKA